MSSTKQSTIKPCDCDKAKIAAEKAIAEASKLSPKPITEPVKDIEPYIDNRYGKPIDHIGSSLII